MALKQYKLNLEEEDVFLVDRIVGRGSRSEWVRTAMKNELDNQEALQNDKQE